jgi:sugar transferase EpsL
MKRGVDIFVSLVGLIVLAPLMAVIALAVRLTMGSPVVFRQKRPGIHERPFTILKFRSMRDVTRSSGVPPPDDERLTRIGMVLRTTSLDELPELWNVLKGDMSLVGPRPLLVRYTPYFTPRERLRMGVRPGITGWAQINGRNLSSWDDRLENDVWYVENWSLRLDIRILALTLREVVSRSGVVADARSVMLNLDEERASIARE